MKKTLQILYKISLTLLVLMFLFGVIYLILYVLTLDREDNKIKIINAFKEGKTLSCGITYEINNKKYIYEEEKEFFYNIDRTNYKINKVFPMQCSIKREG